MNSWYSKLNRPPFTPPDWVFGPVWGVLYAMIALSIFLYVRQTIRDRPFWPYALIAIHLLANFCWTPIFFHLQRPGWALVDIIILDISLAAILVVFWRARKASSILLWPYAAWVSFATYLNAGFHFLN
ncbi:MAG: TspO/MBR family protein [Lentisphaeria bacterium]|nr:TspO/MBR family protein [Lentisphaeria bacterium]